MKKILIISSFFYPRNTIGALRYTKIAKYLHLNEYTVDVVALNSTNYSDYKFEYANTVSYIKPIGICTKLLNRKTKSHNIKTNGGKYTKPSKITRYLINFKSIVITLLSFISEVEFSKTYLKMGIDFSQYDVVISTYGGTGNILIAKKIKELNKNILWIMDLRDYVYQPTDNFIGKMYLRKFYQRNCKMCDINFTVTDGLKQRYEKFGKPTYLIHNGYDLEDKKHLEYKPDVKFSIVYAGSLYGGKRSIKVLFQIIRELIDERLIDENLIKFTYLGNEFIYIEDLGKKYNISSMIENRGYVDREKSLEVQNNSDIIVVLNWNNKNYNGVIPAKIYEAMLLKKPLITIVNGNLINSEVKDMIQKYNLGYCYEEMNHTVEYIELKKYLLELYLEYTVGKRNSFLPNSNINRFNYSNLVKKIINLIESH